MSPDNQQNTNEPSPKALRWVADAVGPGATIQSVRHLAGATSSLLHRIEATYDGRGINLVLRQFCHRDWLEEEPDLALHEAMSLQKVGQANIPTPELIAYDQTGDRCGVPAILMTQLPGSVELKPTNLDGWLIQLAAALIPLHAIEVGDFPWRYRPYNDIARLEPPGWSRAPELWKKAIGIVAGPWPDTELCFIHRDYHPTNVLWLENRVSGIVDWPNACRGAAGIDLAWCRGNLIHLYGVAAADRFLTAYQTLAGGSFDYHPFWDLIVIIEALPGPPKVYPPWLTFGVRHLSSEVMQERLDAYLSSVMARF